MTRQGRAGIKSCQGGYYNLLSPAQLARDHLRIAPKVLLPGSGVAGGEKIRCARSGCYRGGMDKTMSQTTRREVLTKLRRRYEQAVPGAQAQAPGRGAAALGYHRKSAIRALGVPAAVRVPWIITGRPTAYEPGRLLPWLRSIWAGGGLRLRAAVGWPCCRNGFRPMSSTSGDSLRRRGRNSLRASARTLDRLLEPLRVQGARRSLTRPGTLLRQQIPIRGSVWEEGKAYWLEVDTGWRCAAEAWRGEFVWMLDGVDCATTWVGGAGDVGPGPGRDAGGAAAGRGGEPAVFVAGFGQ